MNIIKVLAFAILAQSVAACKSDDTSSGALVPGVSINDNLQVITSQSEE